jgi:translation initiation factor IF-3
LITNEKIKALEVYLSGIEGEDLGLVATKEALRMAKALKVDLVCLSLTSSPPSCKLVKQSDYIMEQVKEKHKERKAQTLMKTKEIRLSAFIEAHDYDTKKRQAERILATGDAVQLTVQIENKQNQAAKMLIERLLQDLASYGKPDKGLQISGKRVEAIIKPT